MTLGGEWQCTAYPIFLVGVIERKIKERKGKNKLIFGTGHRWAYSEPPTYCTGRKSKPSLVCTSNSIINTEVRHES